MAIQPPVPVLPGPVPSAATPAWDATAWLPAAAQVATVFCSAGIVLLIAWLLLRRRDLIDPRVATLLLAGMIGTGAAQLVFVWGLPGAGGVALAVLAGASAVAAVALWRARTAEAAAPPVADGMPEFLASLPEAVFVLHVSPRGRLRLETATPAFERLLALPPGTAAGAAAEAVLPRAFLAAAMPAWRAAVMRGETVEHEVLADLPGGRRCLRTVLVPQRDAAGRVARLLGWMRDVTATRRLEQGLAQGARLAAVGTMCAGLAHEASQPLNAATLWLRRVRGAAQGLPEASRAPIVQAAQVVDDQLRRAGVLLEQIRSLAEEDPRAAELFDAAQPVAAAVRLAAARYATEGITLALEGGGASVPVRGSAARLEQAVLQLLSNARDAVHKRRRTDPQAPARIEVALRRAGTTAAIEVRDSGTGVAEGLVPAIFDPFFTTKDPGRGSGLGLALASSVARAMGGGIETWNLPAGGACFRMELALAEPLPARAPGAVAAA